MYLPGSALVTPLRHPHHTAHKSLIESFLPTRGGHKRRVSHFIQTFYLLRITMLTAIERIEHDLLGDLAVPAAAYYGVHTLRALENFPITGIPISAYPNLVNALASVKEAAALANYDLGLLSELKMRRSCKPASRSARAWHTSTSSSTSFRAARAPRRT